MTGVLLKHLDQISLYGLPIYALALSTMSWRALARIRKIDERSLLLTRILCGIGSVLFVISDSIIAFNKFYVTIPNSGVSIFLSIFFYYWSNLSNFRFHLFLLIKILPEFIKKIYYRIQDYSSNSILSLQSSLPSPITHLHQCTLQSFHHFFKVLWKTCI